MKIFTTVLNKCSFFAQDNRNKETQQQDCVEIAKLKSSSHRPEANITVERANLGLYIDRRSAYRS